MAQAMRTQRRYLKKDSTEDHFLFGFMYCGECGQKLVFRNYIRPPKYEKVPAYYCRDYGKSKCPDRKSYRICLFEDAVKQEIRNFIKICKQEEAKIREFARTYEFKDLVFDEKMNTLGIDKLIGRNAVLDTLIQKLFEYIIFNKFKKCIIPLNFIFFCFIINSIQSNKTTVLKIIFT